MSADFLWFDWAIDAEGHPWVRHECADRTTTFGIDAWRLPPPWHINDEGNIEPSLDCKRCGRHTFLYECDRLPWERFTAMEPDDA